jgi:hypothetical protein
MATGRWVAAIVAQPVGCACGRRAEIVVDARDCTQILVDSFDLVVGHVLKHRPGHNLELAAVDRRRDANAVRYIGVGI